MFGIGDKKKTLQRGGGGIPVPLHAPVDEVNALSSRGFSEPEIVNALKKQGHSIPEIDEAMKTALKGAASGSPPPGMNQGFNPSGTMPRGNEFTPPPGMDLDHPSKFTDGFGNREFEKQPTPEPSRGMDSFNQEPPMNDNASSYPPPVQPNFDMPTGNNFSTPSPTPSTYTNPKEENLSPLNDSGRERKVNKKQIEELVEVIIEEKWHSMKSRMSEMDTKFLEINNKMVALENTMRQMKVERGDELHQIETKIDGYKGAMNDMNGKMQSMENAMRDSLTPLIGTLRSLSETINALKEKKGI